MVLRILVAHTALATTSRRHWPTNLRMLIHVSLRPENCCWSRLVSIWFEKEIKLKVTNCQCTAWQSKEKAFLKKGKRWFFHLSSGCCWIKKSDVARFLTMIKERWIKEAHYDRWFLRRKELVGKGWWVKVFGSINI